MLTTSQMVNKLRDCGRGSLLFVSYKAGEPPTDRQMLESERAVHEEGCNRRHYVGTLEALWTTRRGQKVLTIMAYNRDKLTGEKLHEGGYRTFNPEVGELLSLEVIERRPKDRVQTLFEAAQELPEGELRDLANKLSELVQTVREEA
jgi:hypothetical protein